MATGKRTVDHFDLIAGCRAAITPTGSGKGALVGREPGPHRPEPPSDNGRGRENARLCGTGPLLPVPIANEVIGCGGKAR